MNRTRTNDMLTALPRPLTQALLAAGLMLGALTITGCDSSGPAEGSLVSVGFQSTVSATAQTQAKASADALVISGTNGSLTIDDIRLIVSGIELEGEGDDVSEYESRPSALDLPLGDADAAVVATDDLPVGIYSTFEFEVEDVEFEDGDDDDQEERDVLRGLLQTLRRDYPTWPEGASMVVKGAFTDDSGRPTPFTTYFDAEIEVERPLTPPLDITGDGPARQLTVRLDPGAWFLNSDGSVDDLSARNWADTETLVEFDAEFENGIVEIEFGDDDDDD